MTANIEDMVHAARTVVRSLSPAEVEASLIVPTAKLVDVREPEELDEQGLIAGAFHAPRGLLEFWADERSPDHRVELDPKRPTIVCCSNGSRSALAAEVLHQLGWADVAHLDGGIEAWKQAGLPVVGLRSWHRHHDHENMRSHR